MVAEGAGAVGAGGSGAAVRIKGQCPAPGVDDDEVVEFADRAEVAEGCGPADGAGDVVISGSGLWVPLMTPTLPWAAGVGRCSGVAR